MSTKIRLARGGSKKRPFYRIVVADSRAPRDGKFIEKVGTYNPMVSENRVVLQEERITDWLSKGAIPSERVLVFLNQAKLGQDFKVVKELNKKRDNVIALKADEIAAKKKAEAEEKARKEAEAKAAEEAAKKEAEEAAAVS